MNENIVQEILHELFSSLESLETQSTAILQLLKEKGLATEQELAGPLEQAGNAANVKWRAAQVRIEHLISGALKSAEREAKPETAKPEEKSKESSTEKGEEKSGSRQDEKEVSKTRQEPSDQRTERSGGDKGGEKSENQPAKQKENEAAKQNQSERTNRQTEGKPATSRERPTKCRLKRAPCSSSYKGDELACC